MLSGARKGISKSLELERSNLTLETGRATRISETWIRRRMLLRAMIAVRGLVLTLKYNAFNQSTLYQLHYHAIMLRHAMSIHPPPPSPIIQYSCHLQSHRLFAVCWMTPCDGGGRRAGVVATHFFKTKSLIKSERYEL